MYSVKEVAYSEWLTHLKEIQYVNMLQHWQYGIAKEQTGKWKAVRFIIMKDGQLIAIAQFLVKMFPFLQLMQQVENSVSLVGINGQ